LQTYLTSRKKHPLSIKHEASAEPTQIAAGHITQGLEVAVVVGGGLQPCRCSAQGPWFTHPYGIHGSARPGRTLVSMALGCRSL